MTGITDAPATAPVKSLSLLVAAVHHGKAGKSKAKKESEAIKVHQHEKESKGSKVHGPPFSMQMMGSEDAGFANPRHWYQLYGFDV